LYDITIKDVDFEGWECMVSQLILLEGDQKIYVSPIVMLFWKHAI